MLQHYCPPPGSGDTLARPVRQGQAVVRVPRSHPAANPSAPTSVPGGLGANLVRTLETSPGRSVGRCTRGQHQVSPDRDGSPNHHGSEDVAPFCGIGVCGAAPSTGQAQAPWPLGPETRSPPAFFRSIILFLLPGVASPSGSDDGALRDPASARDGLGHRRRHRAVGQPVPPREAEPPPPPLDSGGWQGGLSHPGWHAQHTLSDGHARTWLSVCLAVSPLPGSHPLVGPQPQLRAGVETAADEAKMPKQAGQTAMPWW